MTGRARIGPRAGRTRVAVSSPQTRLAMAWRPDVPHLAPGERERAVALYRIQLRRALVAVALLAGLVVGLPVLLAAFPGLDGVRLLGVPVSWLAVGLLPYAGLIALAAWHLRRAERAENGTGRAEKGSGRP